MGLTQLMDKDVIMFLLEERWAKYKKDFIRDGGFSNGYVWIKIFLLMWALHTIAR